MTVRNKAQRSAPTIDPKWDEWDFSSCPNDERRVCYLYEYSIGSSTVVKTVTAIRRALERLRAPELRLQQTQWLKANARPKGKVDLFAWKLKCNRDLGMPFVEAQLPAQLQFLVSFKPFPTKHWLAISSQKRRAIAKTVPEISAFWHVAESRALEPLHIESLDTFLRTHPPAWLPKLAREDFYFVISLNWERSATDLAGDFKKWLLSYPERKQSLHERHPELIRKTTPKEWLRYLSFLRLSQHFKTIAKARRWLEDYELESADYFLQKDDSFWFRSSGKAEREINRFNEAVGHFGKT